MTPTQRIDQQIADLADWRGERVAQIRALVGGAEPELVEDWKWNTGMWTLDKKLICGYGAFKEHVKINFFKGVHLPDPSGLFNNGADAKESRSIDLRKDDPLDEAAVTALVHAAVAYTREPAA